MQERKKIILQALAETIKELRGKQSQFMFASENDISTSIISTIERGLKDPQLTTLFKIAEAFGMTLSELMKKIEKHLPNGFSMIEK